MRPILALLTILTLTSCRRTRSDAETVTNGDITLKRYYYSEWTSVSPEYVEVTKKDSVRLISESPASITQLMIRKDTIVIRYGTAEAVKKRYVKKRVFGYFIKYELDPAYDPKNYIP